MKILTACFFVFLSLQLAAQRSSALRNSHQAERRLRVDSLMLRDTTNSDRLGGVSLQSFFEDTLRNDSFFSLHYARYRLPQTQLEPLNKGNITPLIKQTYTRPWIIIVIAIIAVVLLFIKFSFAKLYKNAILSFLNRSATAEIINDKYSPRGLFVLFANLFFVLVVSLWISSNFLKLGETIHVQRPNQFVFIVAIILLVYITKFFLHLIAGLIFQSTEAVIVFIINISITNLWSGISLLIATLLLLYSPWHGQEWLINVSFGIFLLFIFLRYLRGLIQTMEYFNYNYLYLILYLCTLEIAPWFLIMKYLNNYL
ncbi:MAG: DUF4271 domain-containing protein [Bacteroidetes bacterium]|nr:DUF4271 domain-containing protein [Bacteroidota bacterium]